MICRVIRTVFLAIVVCTAFSSTSVLANYISTLNSLAGSTGISYWDLNETSGTTAADAWTTGTLDGNNAGTYSGAGYTLGTAGPSGVDGFNGFSSSNKAVSFTGTTDQLLKMTNVSSFGGASGPKDLSMVLWFNMPSSVSGARFLGGIHADTFEDPGQRYGFVLGGSSDNLRGYIRLQEGIGISGEDGGNTTNSSGSGAKTFRDGEWHMAVLTMRDDVGTGNKEFRIYIDGDLYQSPSPVSGSSGKSIGDRHTQNALHSFLTFGGDQGDTTRSFIGSLDEIAFIGRSLSGAEVSDLYTAAVVPEPAAFVLVALGGLMGMGLRCRSARAAA